jgi:predicted transposase/invertase (TIGR01784 family)
MKKINNPHDKFIKDLFSEKEMAVSFFESYLPKDVLAILDLNTLDYPTTNFITSDLEEYFSDIVFRVKSKNEGTEFFVSILIEHKSYPDKLTLFQIGSYLCNGYINQAKQGQDFHVIIPMIYYNGGKQWEIINLEDLFEEIPPTLKKYLPIFSYEFLDLTRLTEEEILNLQNGMLASSMLIQKYRLDPKEMVKKFNLIINTLAPFHKGNFLYKFIVYLYNVSEFSNFELEKLITNNNVISQELKKEIMSTADMLIAKGKAEGIAEGKAEGIAEGKAKGIAEGKAEGIEEGKAKEKEIIVCNAYKKVSDITFVAEIALLTNEQVIEILKKNGLM